MRAPSRAGAKKGVTRRQAAKARIEPYFAVCLIGYSEMIVARGLGDNYGATPVAVVVTKKKRAAEVDKAAENYDRGLAFQKCIVLEHVRVPTEEHAKRLKGAIDRVLLGEQAGKNNRKARRIWRDVRGCFETDEERKSWWGEVLQAAIIDLEDTVRDVELELERGIWG